jgi:hypothetical protein
LRSFITSFTSTSLLFHPSLASWLVCALQFLHKDTVSHRTLTARAVQASTLAAAAQGPRVARGTTPHLPRAQGREFT